MNYQRRRFLHLAAGATALPAVSRIARAQSYPSRPIRLVVGFPAGQTADTIARVIAQWLSERLGQQVFVDNRPGAASNIATEFVVRAPADGYTLLSIVTSNFINATLYGKLPYDLVRDIAPVASTTYVPLLMVVNPSVPAKTVPQFIAYAKANPGKLNMASGGIGNSTHVTGELFKMMTGVDLVHVPYRGSPPALTDLISGQVQVMFDVLSSSLEHVKSGRLRALGVTTASRQEVLPDIPTIAESVPGYEAVTIGGLGGPKGTATEIIEKLNKEVNAGLADPKVKARFAELGIIPLSSSPTDWAKLIAAETAKWAKAIKFSGAKAE
jgi:tripartite-type tricarboxylate transporter receptor subunit TctC